MTNLSVGVSPGGAQFVTGTGRKLDGLITGGTATITAAQAVPEPASLVMLGTGCAGLLGYARRRKANATA